MEQQELAKLTSIKNPSPADAISIDQAQNLLDSINEHPVVGDKAYDSYNRKGTEIGFCFGRAAYVHLALLRMGVKKDAIKKIWTVGETGGEVNWIYHVATAVRTTDGNWTVIDNFVGHLLTAQEWASEMREMTVDGKKATFITDAKRFHPGADKYTRVELGLNLTKQADFYQHYFKDLFKWFGSLSSHKWFDRYGLAKVDGQKVKVPTRLLPRPATPVAAPVVQQSTLAKVAGWVCRPLGFADIFRRSN